LGLRDSLKRLFSSRKGEDRASLSRKVQESPQDPQLRQKLGLFLIRQGEIVEGIDQLARTAVLYEKGGFTSKAIAVLRHMLKQDASNPDLQRWLIRLLVQQGHTGDAQDQLMKVASGAVRFSNDVQKIEFLRQAGESLPDHPLPFLLAADLFLAQRKFFEAVGELEKASAHVASTGMAPEFAARIDALASRSGDNFAVLEACGFLWLSAGRTAEALPMLRQAAGLARNLEEHHNLAGAAVEVLEAIEGGREAVVAGAMSFADAARKLAEPQPPPPREEESAAEAPPSPAGQDEEARMVQDAVSRLQAKVQEEIGESDLDARYNLGIAYKEMGLLAEAAEEFRVARRSPSQRLGASFMLAETLGAMGEVDAAGALLDELLSFDDLEETTILDVRYQKALLVSRAGREKEAAEILLSIYEDAPDFRDVRERTEKFRP
jgi:tetratricopeptide (TPR) repeat protein